MAGALVFIGVIVFVGVLFGDDAVGVGLVAMATPAVVALGVADLNGCGGGVTPCRAVGVAADVFAAVGEGACVSIGVGGDVL